MNLKILVPIFAFAVAVFGIIKVSIWNNLDANNITFICFIALAMFLSGLLFGLNKIK